MFNKFSLNFYTLTTLFPSFPTLPKHKSVGLLVDKLIIATGGGVWCMSLAAKQVVNMQDKYCADFFLPPHLFSFIMKESFCAGLALARGAAAKNSLSDILHFNLQDAPLSDSSLIKYLSLPSAGFTVTVTVI